jgi:hypothetical protein
MRRLKVWPCSLTLGLPDVPGEQFQGQVSVRLSVPRKGKSSRHVGRVGKATACGVLARRIRMRRARRYRCETAPRRLIALAPLRVGQVLKQAKCHIRVDCPSLRLTKLCFEPEQRRQAHDHRMRNVAPDIGIHISRSKLGRKSKTFSGDAGIKGQT